MPVEFENSLMTVSNSTSGETNYSSGHLLATGSLPPPPKKKRNLPGMPDPEAEVIALSPKTLLATNRFVCEICNKGFQRDQNLQLHRRGHNLPWKLRQRTGNEVKKRVYVCPEPSCVHNHPSRALGDLTGIKKHFCRKHGEKKWKCNKCSKKYAVQSDWKAHAKTCGTREYRCDCGTLFSRRDSFITHRAFCDALAEESARTNATVPEKATKSSPQAAMQGKNMVLPPPPLLDQKEPENAAGLLQYLVSPVTRSSMSMNCSNSSSTTTSGGGSNLFVSSAATPKTSFSDLIGSMSRTEVETSSLCLSSNGPATSLFAPATNRLQFPALPPSAHMSATALLQKAAQMGAAASGSSFLCGFGLAGAASACSGGDMQWQERTTMSAGLGLGLPYDSGGSRALFCSKPAAATLDFLGLGMGAASAANAGGLSAFINSIGGGGLEAYSTGGGGGDVKPGGGRTIQ